MPTDISERGLEDLIVRSMTGRTNLLSPPHVAGDTSAPVADGTGWHLGDPSHYDRDYCVDLVQLRGFLLAIQPALVDAFSLATEGPTRQKFLSRLQGEIARRGTIDVLRKGIKHGPHDVTLFYGTPSPGNDKAREAFLANRFSVTRQLRYSREEAQRALDLALFVNGLPVATWELKNNLTRQTWEDAVDQYKRDRDPREKFFEFARCVVHFAVDDQQVWFCTHLQGKASWFLPFNKGLNDGAGNPPASDGIATDYLWKKILTRESLTNILENFAQIVTEKDPKTEKKKTNQIWPRYHQLDAVRSLLADAATRGCGRRYLIQHSAGSGKSNSIGWLAHQLIGIEKAGAKVFDTVIVVTDRTILDKQIRDTVKQFSQVSATIGHAEDSGDLRRFLTEGKKIVITTVQKFPWVLDEIGNDQRGRKFAIIIDEAHSSQGGKATAAMSRALSEAGEDDDDESTEDRINRLIEAKKLLPNASYFAFTATPKPKTLEIFGEALPATPQGKIPHRPFHSYTMKQAIQEGFILDVLAFYTPVASYYRLVKKVEADPEFDTKRAKKKLRRYVESHDHAIRLKAEIMVDHFHEHVFGLKKIGGEARAMVVTSGIDRAIQYFHAIRDYLQERKSPFKAIVAFSGEPEYGGQKVSEASLNGFPSARIAERFREEPYRFLICADKFQTGYDEPLLHTMYVDKMLSGIKAVQTLSRLNRARQGKGDTFVLDFLNDVDTIRESFSDFYRTTILAEETDPNKLHDLQRDLDAADVYSRSDLDDFVTRFLAGEGVDTLQSILGRCASAYGTLDEDGQAAFKGNAKAFVRVYGFLSTVLPFSNSDWEKLSIFLTFLVRKLPAPVEEDLSRGILDAIDMDSYRVEKQATMAIALADEDATISPPPVASGGRKPEPELDRLSAIIQDFNDRFGNIAWEHRDRIERRIAEEIPNLVDADPAYTHARMNSDRQNARIEHDKALSRVLVALMKDETQLFKEFSDNPSFKRWLADSTFTKTYRSG
jgi:type I restriction enzyme R subunit